MTTRTTRIRTTMRIHTPVTLPATADRQPGIGQQPLVDGYVPVREAIHRELVGAHATALDQPLPQWAVVQHSSDGGGEGSGVAGCHHQSVVAVGRHVPVAVERA